MACPEEDPEPPALPCRAGAVIAVKDLSRAKSRMAALPPAHRGRLAGLMAVVVAKACAEVLDAVVIVTTAPGIGTLLAAHGVSVRVVADPRSGLNAAFEAGAQALVESGCELVVACMGDLPALTPAGLADALAGCSGHGRWFVRDDEETGTTLLAARGASLAPAFGPDSATRHMDSGAVELTASAGLRLDADTPDDLLRAAALGIGHPVSPLIDGDQIARHTTGTVVGGSGEGWELLLTTGFRTYAPAGALAPEVRQLAPGQRVHLVRTADGAVRHLWI
ncbi:MAG TPA: 2-phospho-L-lactate guanylyltransferase [Propionibacterium sp.]|nr:2-phospho-L-lactate guanylyltransferase [Propionibacterium sp.]